MQVVPLGALPAAQLKQFPLVAEQEAQVDEQAAQAAVPAENWPAGQAVQVRAPGWNPALQVKQFPVVA